MSAEPRSLAEELLAMAVYASAVAQLTVVHLSAGRGGPTDEDFDRFHEEAMSIADSVIEAAKRRAQR